MTWLRNEKTPYQVQYPLVVKWWELMPPWWKVARSALIARNCLSKRRKAWME